MIVRYCESVPASQVAAELDLPIERIDETWRAATRKLEERLIRKRGQTGLNFQDADEDPGALPVGEAPPVRSVRPVLHPGARCHEIRELSRMMSRRRCIPSSKDVAAEVIWVEKVFGHEIPLSVRTGWQAGSSGPVPEDFLPTAAEAVEAIVDELRGELETQLPPARYEKQGDRLVRIA